MALLLTAPSLIPVGHAGAAPSSRASATHVGAGWFAYDVEAVDGWLSLTVRLFTNGTSGAAGFTMIDDRQSPWTVMLMHRRGETWASIDVEGSGAPLFAQPTRAAPGEGTFSVRHLASGNFSIVAWGAGDVARFDVVVAAEGEGASIARRAEHGGADRTFFSNGAGFEGEHVIVSAGGHHVTHQEAGRRTIHASGTLIGVVGKIGRPLVDAQEEQITMTGNGVTYDCPCYFPRFTGDGALAPGEYVIERTARGAQVAASLAIVLIDVDWGS